MQITDLFGCSDMSGDEFVPKITTNDQMEKTGKDFESEGCNILELHKNLLLRKWSSAILNYIIGV